MPGRTGAAWDWVAVATALLATAACGSGGGGGGAPVPTAPGIFTQRYDAQRSGVNSREVTLTPDSVRTGTFGKLFNGTPNGSGSDGPAILFAYDPATLAVLYRSPGSGTDAAGNAVKFAVPTVINGKVYVGTQTELSVFGLL